MSVVWRAQAIELGLHRSDYMMHQQPEGPPIPLQVELNTISSAFACLSSNVAQMHRHAFHLLHSTLALRPRALLLFSDCSLTLCRCRLVCVCIGMFWERWPAC